MGAICKECKQDMAKVDTCVASYLMIDGQKYHRDVGYFDVNERCHDCGIENKVGNFHHFGCDVERCPKCKGQLISCGCLKNEDVMVDEGKVVEYKVELRVKSKTVPSLIEGIILRRRLRELGIQSTLFRYRSFERKNKRWEVVKE